MDGMCSVAWVYPRVAAMPEYRCAACREERWQRNTGVCIAPITEMMCRMCGQRLPMPKRMYPATRHQRAIWRREAAH